MSRIILETVHFVVGGVLVHTLLVHGAAVMRTWIAGRYDFAIARLAVGQTSALAVTIDRNSRGSVSADLPDASSALEALTHVGRE